MVKLRESYPLGAIRRQAKAKLAQPTASFQGETVMIIGSALPSRWYWDSC